MLARGLRFGELRGERFGEPYGECVQGGADLVGIISCVGSFWLKVQALGQ